MPTDAIKIWKLNVKNRSVCMGYCKLNDEKCNKSEKHYSFKSLIECTLDIISFRNRSCGIVEEIVEECYMYMCKEVIYWVKNCLQY